MAGDLKPNPPYDTTNLPTGSGAVSQHMDTPFVAGGLTPWQIYLVITSEIDSFQWKKGARYSKKAVLKRAPTMVPDEWERQALADFFADAIGIVLAESKGKPTAKGGPNSDGSFDWGLFQINDVHNSTSAEKSEPVANTRAAGQVFRDADHTFKPWSTWPTPSDSFRKYGYECHGRAEMMGELAVNAAFVKMIASFPGTAIGSGIFEGGKAIGGALDWAAPVLKFVRDAGIAAGAFVGALVLLIIGALILISRSKTAKRALKVAAPIV